MSTKCITVTQEAYENLASCKEGKESFSDVINRMTHKYSFFDLVGVLSEDEARCMEENMKTIRKSLRKRLSHTARQLQ